MASVHSLRDTYRASNLRIAAIELNIALTTVRIPVRYEVNVF